MFCKRAAIMALAACLGLVVSLAGCQGPAYINIPAEQGDMADHNPNGQVARDVMAQAVRGLIEHEQLATPVAIELPKGATALSTADVARRAGEGVVSSLEQNPTVKPAITIHIRGVRVRADKAEVDIVVPDRGVPHLDTVHLDWANFGGWKTQRVRVWQGNVNTLLPLQE